MIKVYITVLETKENGQAVTLFEDYKLEYDDKNSLGLADSPSIQTLIHHKIEEVEAINNQETKPF